MLQFSINRSINCWKCGNVHYNSEGSYLVSLRLVLFSPKNPWNFWVLIQSGTEPLQNLWFVCFLVFVTNMARFHCGTPWQILGTETSQEPFCLFDGGLWRNLGALLCCCYHQESSWVGGWLMEPTTRLKLDNQPWWKKMCIWERLCNFFVSAASSFSV